MQGSRSDSFLQSSSRPLSIGYVSRGWPTNAFTNGIVTYVGQITDALRQLGHSPHILTHEIKGPTPSPDANVHLIDNPGMLDRLTDSIRMRFSVHRAVEYRNARSIIRTATRIARTSQLDLIEIEESFGLARLLVGRLPIPVVVRMHGPWGLVGPMAGAPDDQIFRRRVRIEGLGLVAAAGITAPSAFVRDWACKHYNLAPRHMEVIPNPVDLASPDQHWQLAGCDPNLILFIGRFDRLKGVDLIIESFKRISRDYPAVRLRLIGPPKGVIDPDNRSITPTEYLEAQLPGAQASGRVQWLGPLPQDSLAGHRREALACVVCSRYETFPMAVLEAMSLGCPIVASNVGGIPEVVSDGHNGLLFKSGDADDLAARLRWLLDNPHQAARLGSQAAIDCAQRFDPTRLASQMISYYDRVLRDSASHQSLHS